VLAIRMISTRVPARSPITNSKLSLVESIVMSIIFSAQKPRCVRSRARGQPTYKDSRIRVNEVSPGSTDTHGLSELLASSETGEQRKKMISSMVPLGMFGTSDEIAKAVVFLASDDSSYITRIELFVDGGIA
jgi:NAD(P)-dependent dehydrogenase (short-subunit alcohol dehydrogenase family)